MMNSVRAAGGNSDLEPPTEDKPKTPIETKALNSNFDGLQTVSDALKTVASNKKKVMVVGYSPTGGGHTDRTLDIVKAADLPEGSAVVLHVPEKWDHKERPKSLNDLGLYLEGKKIKLIAAEADKSVYGYLIKKEDGKEGMEIGGSNDGNIIERSSTYARRTQDALPSLLAKDRGTESLKTVDSIEHGATPGTNGSGENFFAKLPVISAKNLMSSLKTTIGTEAMERQVMVLTDMDPSLQKAAKENGVPDHHRLDQQNHAILLKNMLGDLFDESGNYQEGSFSKLPQKEKIRFSLLAKVLGGTGEIVSHIDLGKKNTLISVAQNADLLGVGEDKTKQDARNAVVKLMLENKDKIIFKKSSGATPSQGMLFHDSIKNEKDADKIKNIVYIYAHGKTDFIERRVRQMLNPDASSSGAKGDITEDAKKAYEGTLFLFCGKGVVPEEVGNYDVMKLGYLADGDGITTSGAGAHGEFAYLQKAGSQARLLALPIQGHNEQEVNAEELGRDLSTAVTVMKSDVWTNDNSRNREIDDYVLKCFGNAKEKYAPVNTMKKLMEYTRSEDTYVKQAVDLLFKQTEGGAAVRPFNSIELLEKEMHDDPLLKANRRYLKIVEQSLEDVRSHIKDIGDDEIVNLADIKGIKISFSAQKPDSKEFDNISKVNEFLNSDGTDGEVKEILKFDVNMSGDSLLNHSDVKDLFARLASGGMKKSDIISEIKGLNDKLGHTLVTGF
jgi:hypothetical protein